MGLFDVLGNDMYINLIEGGLDVWLKILVRNLSLYIINDHRKFNYKIGLYISGQNWCYNIIASHTEDWVSIQDSPLGNMKLVNSWTSLGMECTLKMSKLWLDRKMKWVFKINDIFSIVIRMLNVVMVKFDD